MNILRKSIFISLLLTPALHAQTGTINFTNKSNNAVRFYVTCDAQTCDDTTHGTKADTTVDAGGTYTVTIDNVCYPWGTENVGKECKQVINAYVDDQVTGAKVMNLAPISPDKFTANLTYPGIDFNP